MVKEIKKYELKIKRNKQYKSPLNPLLNLGGE